jgi:hypothetical protein
MVPLAGTANAFVPHRKVFMLNKQTTPKSQVIGEVNNNKMLCTG